MNVLAFDTCFDACSVAVGRGLRSLTPVIAERFEAMQVGQAERLMPMIEETMLEAGMTFNMLDRIAVTFGPGTFTGTRIGIAAARALSLVCGAPIVTVSSLALMALNPEIANIQRRTLAIATDARRGEAYIERFDSRTFQSIGGPAVLSFADAVHALGSAPVLIAGSAASAIAAEAQAQGRDVRAILPGLLPDALDMLFCAAALPVIEKPAPLYLRPPDAKPPAPSPFFGPIFGPIFGAEA